MRRYILYCENINGKCNLVEREGLLGTYIRYEELVDEVTNILKKECTCYPGQDKGVTENDVINDRDDFDVVNGTCTACRVLKKLFESREI